MKNTDRQNPEFFDEEDVRITDLETPATPRYQRTLRLTNLVMKGIATPWIRYSLTGLLVLILLLALLPQFRAPAFPATGQNVTPTPAPTATPAFYPLSPVLANGQVFIQSENNTLNAFQVTTGHLLWQKQLPTPAQLATTGQLLFCYYVKSPGQSVLEAFDVETGRLAWQRPLSESLPVSQGKEPGFVLDGDVLYTASSTGTIVAFQASDGHPLWSNQAGITARELPLNEVVYARDGIVEIYTEDIHAIIILHADSGRQIARFGTRRYGPPLPMPVDRQLIYTLPGPDDQSIGQSIQVNRVSDGTQVWSRAFPQGFGFVREQDGVIYFSNTNHSSLSALRGSDGHQIWTYQTGDGEAITSFLFSPNGVIHLLQENAVLVSLRASDGHLLWRNESVPASHSVVGDPQMLADQGTLFLYNPSLSDTQNIPIVALSVEDGRVLWQALASPGKLQPMAGILYLLLGQEIDAWSETTGKSLWSYQAPALLNIAGNILNIVLLIDQTGRLGAFRTDDGKPLWFYP